MALARTEITKGGDTTDQQTYTTASVTLTAGRLYVMGITNSDNPAGETAPSTVATTGGGISFALLSSQPWNTTVSPFRYISIWQVQAASTVTDTIAITLADAGTGCHWILLEYTGFNTSTPFGTPAKNATDSGTSVAATPGALAAGSFQVAFCGYGGDAGSTVSGTSWTRIGGTTATNTPVASLDYAENTSGTASQVTFTKVTTTTFGIIAVEVKLAAAGGSTVTATLADTLSPSDTIAGRRNLLGRLADTFSSSDALVRWFNGTRTPSDNFGFADVLNVTSTGGFADNDPRGSRFEWARRNRFWRAFKPKTGDFT